MVIRDEKSMGWFKDSCDIRGDLDEAATRELGESMLTCGRHQDVVAAEEGAVTNVRRLGQVGRKRVWTNSYSI